MQPRGICCSKILATWPNNDGQVLLDRFCLSAGSVQYYFRHSVKLRDQLHQHYFACVRWYILQTKSASLYGNPLIVCKNKFSQAVRWISISGYLMTSLVMASGLHKEESIFTSSLRPWPLSSLYLSHETKRDGEVTTEAHVERNKDGFFLYWAAKCALKVQSTVVLGYFWSGIVFDYT